MSEKAEEQIKNNLKQILKHYIDEWTLIKQDAQHPFYEIADASINAYQSVYAAMFKIESVLNKKETELKNQVLYESDIPIRIECKAEGHTCGLFMGDILIVEDAEVMNAVVHNMSKQGRAELIKIMVDIRKEKENENN